MNKTKTTKKPKLLLSIFLACLIVVALVLAGFLIYRYQAEQAQQERDTELGVDSTYVSEEDKASYTVDATDKPKSLTITTAGVDNARIQEIGLLSPSSDGSQQMDSPQNINDVGWYNCQINPVEENKCANYVSPAGGNDETAAVIDGHSCNGSSNLSCVFDKLGDVKVGDEIDVELGSGNHVVYIVDEVENVALADLDMAKVMKPIKEGSYGLNIITCDGSWTEVDSRGVTTMSRRIVVYSTMKEE